MGSIEESRLKNVGLALMLLRLAEANGDHARAELARAGLRECGFPGGEGSLSIAEAMAEIEAQHD